MVYSLGAIFFVLLIYGPFLWVRFVMWRHSTEIDAMPGTGGELAIHLVERLELSDIKVEMGEEGQDFYSPDEKLISLSPIVFNGRSLTAVAVATHEVGHAIQFSRNEPVSQLRGKYLGGAFRIKRIGSGILLCIPIVTIVVKVPQVILITAIIGMVTMIASALMYLAVLPEEYDASFNKALPILEKGYVSSEHLPAVRQVLTAAALTYFASALADTIRLWRWLRLIR